MPGLRIAANLVNPVFIPAPRMARVSIAPLLKADDRIDVFTQYLQGLKIQPLSEAYVLLLAADDQGAWLRRPDYDVLCRTTQAGNLLRITPDEIESSPAESPRNLLRLVTGARYRCLWTFSSDELREVLAAVDDGSEGIFDVYEFSRLIMAPAPLPPDGAVREEDQAGHDDAKEYAQQEAWSLLDLDQVLLRRLLEDCIIRDPRRTWHGHWNASYLGTMAYPLEGTYFLARSAPIDAMYAAELTIYHAISVCQRSAGAYMTFQAAEDTITAARDKVLVRSLERKPRTPPWVSSLFRDEKRPPDPYWDYIEYAYACGFDLRVPRTEFFTAMGQNMFTTEGGSVGPSRWYLKASHIESAYGHRHPSRVSLANDPSWSEADSWEELPFARLEEEDRKRVCAYFDYFRFGAAQWLAKWRGMVVTAVGVKDTIITALRERARLHLERTGYRRLLNAISCHVPGSPDDRVHVNKRYIDLAIQIEYPWWGDLPDDASGWAPLRKQLDTWVGPLTDKGGALFREHFGEVENLILYARLARSFNERKLFESIFRKMSRTPWSTSAAQWSHGAVEIRMARLDAATTRFEIAVGGEPLADVKLIQGSHELPHTSGRASQTLRFKSDPLNEPYTLDWSKAAPPSMRSWPEWMSLFGDVIGLGLTLENLVGKIQKDEPDVRVFVELGRDSFQAVSSLGAAVQASAALAKPGSRMARMGFKVGRWTAEHAVLPGVALEAALNVVDGLEILLSNNGEAARAERRGDPFSAWLYRTKGVTLIASTAVGVTLGYGAFAEAGAASLGAFAGPFGLAVTVGSVVVVGLDLLIDFVAHPAAITEALEEALNDALDHEFKGMPAGGRTVVDLQRFAARLRELADT